MKEVLIAFLLVLTIFSCYDLEDIPGPTASFTTKLNGDGNVTFNISTTDAETFHWDFGDGGFSDEKFPTYTYAKNGVYNVTLSAKGNGGETIKTGQIIVDNITGSVVFWIQATENKVVELTVDGQYYGKIPGFYSTSVPDCGAQNSVTVTNLTEGSHTFAAQELNAVSPLKWMGVISIVGRKCSAMGLTY